MRSRLRNTIAVRFTLLLLAVEIVALTLLIGPAGVPALPVLAGALGILGGGYLAASWVAAGIVQPVRSLQRAARDMAAGDYRRQVPVFTGDELEDVGAALSSLGGTLHQQEAAFRHEAERLHQVLETMVEGVVVFGPDGRVVMENRAMRNFLGAPQPLGGRTPIEAVRDPEFEAAVLRVLTRRLPEVLDLALPTPPDVAISSRFSFTVNLTPLSWEGNAGVVAVFHDVSRIRELEALRRDFVANTSHELRTPLAAIAGYVETLREMELSKADRSRFLEKVATHTERLTRLIEDLLDLSRLESGQARLDPKPLALPGVAARAVGVVETSAQSRGVRLALDLRDDLPSVIADDRSLEQVLVNLMDNAIKYTGAGGEVRVSTRAEEGRLRVLVSDTGIGIPPADIPRLFERFFRVDRSRSRELGGTGLGLAIVKHLVQLMGGEVGVESVVGEGSTFSFTLRTAGG